MRKQVSKMVALVGAAAVAGCLGSAPKTTTPTPTEPTAPSEPTANPSNPSEPAPVPSTPMDPTPSQPPSTTTEPAPSTPPAPAAPSPADVLALRTISYHLALRSAAIKLVGALPTLDEQAAVSDATTYAAQIDKYLADARFSGRMISYFQDMFKMGGPAANMRPSLDTAPVFAASLAVGDKAMTELFTATTGTCPTFATGSFTAADCPTQNGLATAGIITNPGVQSQFYGNMAFRRVRWLQETFVCTKFPAEWSATPVQKGNGQYVSPWPFDSITGGSDKTVAPIDFKDASSVVCANCHSSMNHLAPLFANFDANGVYMTTSQVKTPVPMNPTTKLSDWLPAAEVTSWRFNKPVANLTELGVAMAADPDVANCMVARAWNWAMSKTDIVNDMAVVPRGNIEPLTTAFVSGGYKMKPMLKAIFTHDDFVKF